MMNEGPQTEQDVRRRASSIWRLCKLGNWFEDSCAERLNKAFQEDPTNTDFVVIDNPTGYIRHYNFVTMQVTVDSVPQQVFNIARESDDQGDGAGSNAAREEHEHFAEGSRWIQLSVPVVSTTRPSVSTTPPSVSPLPLSQTLGINPSRSRGGSSTHSHLNASHSSADTLGHCASGVQTVSQRHHSTVSGGNRSLETSFSEDMMNASSNGSKQATTNAEEEELKSEDLETESSGSEAEEEMPQEAPPVAHRPIEPPQHQGEADGQQLSFSERHEYRAELVNSMHEFSFGSSSEEAHRASKYRHLRKLSASDSDVIAMHKRRLVEGEPYPLVQCTTVRGQAIWARVGASYFQENDDIIKHLPVATEDPVV